jgi:DNA-binding transcriptional LysR family regulator
VWKQVHALEHHLGMQLVEPHTRGCQSTEAGRSLAEMAGPLVTGIGSLKQALQAGEPARATPLTVAASSRLLLDDLPPCVDECERRFPHIRLTLNEMRADQVEAEVASMQADLGLAAVAADPGNPWLLYEPCYELEIVLVTPPDHALARKHRVRAGDLARFPLVNSPTSFADKVLTSTLERLGLFRTQPRRVEAQSPAAIRRYVALGYGIGLIAASPGHRPDPALHERSMAEDLGCLTVSAIRRKGAIPPEAAREFVTIVKTTLDRRQPAAQRPGEDRRSRPRPRARPRRPADPGADADPPR